MQYLVDTGVLLRLFDKNDPAHSAIREGLRSIRTKGDSLVVCPQNVAEFWNVSTRPESARGGYGQSVEATDRRVKFIERFGTVLKESESAYLKWRELAVNHKIEGVAVHDARIVAMMNVYGIQQVITLNGKDFSRYEDIEVVLPEDVK